MGNGNKRLWRKPSVNSRASACSMSPKYIWTLSHGCCSGLLPKTSCKTLSKEVCLCWAEYSVNIQNNVEVATAKPKKGCPGLWHFAEDTHIHHLVSSSDLPLRPLTEPFMWDWKWHLNSWKEKHWEEKDSNIPDATALPTSTAPQGRYSENIPWLLQMILMKAWGKSHLLPVNFQVHTMHSFNFQKMFLSCLGCSVPFLSSESLRTEMALIFKKKKRKRHTKDEGPYWISSL